MAQFSVLSYWRSYSHFKVVAVILIVIGLTWSTEGLRMCYHCNTTISGLECVHNPSNVTDGEVSCKGFCTIRRKDYLYMREDQSLIFLQRACETNPLYLDTVEVEGYFKVYYRSCKSYLCNVGLGIQSLRDMPVDPSWDLYTDDDFGLGSKASSFRFHNLIPIKFLFMSCLTSLVFIYFK